MTKPYTLKSEVLKIVKKAFIMSPYSGASQEACITAVELLSRMLSVIPFYKCILVPHWTAPLVLFIKFFLQYFLQNLKKL